MTHKLPRNTEGPFRADQLRDGDPYELQNGHPIECLPGGGRHSRANLTGGLALRTDPSVDSSGVDTGYSPDAKNLRAPDLAIGNVPDQPGWVSGTPPLAVEYADVGQDERELKDKIAELLGAGTRYIWVVRLTGPRRVDVHTAAEPTQTLYPGQQLSAPGVLKNPVLVEALYDDDAANEAALRNLLQRKGYDDLAQVQAEGEASAQLDTILRQLTRLTGPLDDAHRQAIRQLNGDQRTRLTEALLDFRHKDDLHQWLSTTNTP